MASPAPCMRVSACVETACVQLVVRRRGFLAQASPKQQAQAPAGFHAYPFFPPRPSPLSPLRTLLLPECPAHGARTWRGGGELSHRMCGSHVCVLMCVYVCGPHVNVCACVRVRGSHVYVYACVWVSRVYSCACVWVSRVCVRVGLTYVYACVWVSCVCVCVGLTCFVSPRWRSWTPS